MVVHCLASDLAGWSVEDNEFQVREAVRQVTDGVFEVRAVPGPGLDGTIRSNLQVSLTFKEDLVLAFGTRDGYAFTVALGAAAELDVAVISFVYFTAEERLYRSQFSSHTRSIPSIAGQDDSRTLLLDGEQVLRRVCEESALVVVPTQYLRGQLSSQLPMDLMSKVIVCYHGVDETLFASRGAAWIFNTEWLHVSRVSLPFAAHKNYFWTVEFLRLAREIFPAAHLSIAGEGNARPLLQRYADLNNLEASITLEGFVDQRRVRALYEECSLLFVPSMMEAGATTIVEAVLVGCLPLVLDYAGAPEILCALGLGDFLLPGVVRDRGAGVRSVEPDPAVALNVVKQIANCHAELPSLLQAARIRASEQYSIGRTTAQLLRQLHNRGLLQ